MLGERYGGDAPPDAVPVSAQPPTSVPTEDALAARFWERIRLFAARRLGGVAPAEDVAQETIRRVVDALRAGRVNDPDALPGFVFQTARHICQQHVRSAGRGARALARLASRDREPAAELDAIAALIAAERCTAVRRALMRLDLHDRELLSALYYERAEPTSVAHRLGISEGALRVRKHRALRRLADLLGEDVS